MFDCWFFAKYNLLIVFVSADIGFPLVSSICVVLLLLVLLEVRDL